MKMTKKYLSITFIFILVSCDNNHLQNKNDLELLKNENYSLKNQLNEKNNIGRFQIVNSSDGIFLIDTKIGIVWEKIRYTDLQGTPRIWKEMHKENKIGSLLEEHPFIPEAKP